ncbi:MAG TPA: efflux RND transporter periplasmic adaptor subunit [Verrucomicrobiae bacterium]
MKKDIITSYSYTDAFAAPRLRLLILLTSAALAAVLLLTGCAPSGQQQRPPPPPVTVAPVEQKEIVEWNEFTGRTEPVESVEVRPRVSGYIQAVKFQSGQPVSKGDVLFVIDPRWHQAEFDRLQAEAERARVQLDNAKREADRTVQLLANSAISTEEADGRVARFQEARATLLAVQAARDSAKLDLEYTQVRAPISGRVSRALLTEGNYVSGLAGSATMLTTIVSINPIYVYADIDEDTLLKFNGLAGAKKLETTGDGKIPVELQLGDEPDFSHHGTIESFDNRLDPNTGSILLRALFSNDDGRIVPGLFARIRIPLSERRPALLVEERAIGTDQAQKYVLTLTPTNTVAYHTVTLGPAIEGKRIVRAGLHGDEQIVVNGLQRVRPGMPVTPEQELAGGNALHVVKR